MGFRAWQTLNGPQKPFALYLWLYGLAKDLAGMVQQQFELDPFTNARFLFRGRRRDCVKDLYWEQNGLSASVYHKQKR